MGRKKFTKKSAVKNALYHSNKKEKEFFTTPSDQEKKKSFATIKGFDIVKNTKGIEKS